MHNDGGSAATSPMFPPSSPVQPSSPGTQMAMQMLGNLMQMQGLDSAFSLPSSAGGTTSSTSQHQYNSLPAFNIQNATNSPPNLLSTPGYMGGNMPPSASLLEQQIKLQQLQQLHQMQNQIFQQQMALIAGQSPVLSSKPPGIDLSQQYSQQSSTSNQPHESPYLGLPTPGPSTELRPQQHHSNEFVSPMILNNYNESSNHQPASNNSAASSHSTTPSPMITSTYHGEDGNNNNNTFSQQLPPPMTDYGGHNMHHGMHRGIASAPEHLAFDIRSGREFDLDVSPLTSPWLGPFGEPAPPLRIQTHRQSMSHSRSINGNKRTASPHNDESASRPARKKYGQMGQGTSSTSTGMLPPMSPPTTGRRQTSGGQRTPKSNTSTPLLRGTRTRSKSGAGMSMSMGMSPIQQGQGVEAQSFSVASMLVQGGGVPEDSPSPVDLSVSPAKSNSYGADQPMDVATGIPPHPDSAKLVPVTPASIMNLGRLGMSSSAPGPNHGEAAGPISSSASTASSTSASSFDAGVKPSSGPIRGSRSRNKADGNGVKTLKTILPAGDPNFANAPSSAAESNLPPGVKKTSHKAAEQKRRDSLKTTFDDLRKLLPPIAFEDAIPEEDDPAGSSSSNGKPKDKDKDKVLPVRGPLLPGALPPRGPPKAGGDGPNKGISKLQLLICGNQYIRTLKGRIERRDHEIAVLRKEVARLRGASGDGGMYYGAPEDGNGGEEEIDLEKDIDAVEGMGVRIGLVPGGPPIGEEDEDEETA